MPRPFSTLDLDCYEIPLGSNRALENFAATSLKIWFSEKLLPELH